MLRLLVCVGLPQSEVLSEHEQVVLVVQCDDHSTTRQLPQLPCGLFLCRLRHYGQGGERECVADAGCQLDDLLQSAVHSLYLADEQVDHVTADVRIPELLHVPTPSAATVVECEQPVLMQRGEDGEDEKRVALCANQKELGQLRGGCGRTAQCVFDQRSDVRQCEWLQQYTVYAVSCVVLVLSLQLGDHLDERMRRASLVVSIRANEQQIGGLLCEESAKELK